MIIFLLTGNARTFPFNIINNKRNINILDSYNKYIFTDTFKSSHDYRIFISTDDIHLKDTYDYFSLDKIGNIHLLNTEFYLHNINNKTGSINKYFDKYNKRDWTGFNKYDNSIHQHYKILDCYNLYKNSNVYNENNYIVRLRMDVKICDNTYNICSLISLLNNPDIKIIMNWDLFAIGKSDIMRCYCNGLEAEYGHYTYKTKIPDNLPIMHDYNALERIRWTFAPERQLFEMLFEYCNVHNIDINKGIMGINFCEIIR